MSDRPCRRRFLEVVAQGGVLAGAAGLGLGCGNPTLSGTYAAGNVSALVMGKLTAVSSGPLALGLDAGGIWAMSLLCTHAGCEASIEATGVSCPCHGSQFDLQGNVLAGPARSPLPHFQVTVDASGAISVDSSVPVSESTRTAT
jgi:Rieske Fe-S protein